MSKVLDSDALSVLRINTLALTAQAAMAAGQLFEFGWTCQDNSVLTLDAAAALGMPAALATFANGLHQHGRGLKDMIDAATNREELDSVDISTGWPGDPVAE